MFNPPPTVTGLPMTRPAGCPFDPPEELTALRERQPISRMAYPDGHTGWLATSHALVRAILADPRFSSRHELMHNPFPGPVIPEIPPAPPGMFIGVDPPEHTRYRKLLTGTFTVRRMRLLTERVEQITAEHLDAMERHGPPAGSPWTNGAPGCRSASGRSGEPRWPPPPPPTICTASMMRAGHLSATPLPPP
ncbi:cytochrome P450 [Streptosporangium album]|uniref:Cytochrome P450 n=1 Tax=Streptosporangium album TaxID=47479 RepID=A0A7W7WE24_9ACTN|nr:cytochrome P450 [Streptosporangium album]